MASIREQLLVAIATALSTVPDVTVERSRVTAVDLKSEGTVLTVMPIAEQVVQRIASRVRRELTIEITVPARGKVPDQAADATASAVHAALFADSRFGGLACELREDSRAWSIDPAEQNVVVVTMAYLIVFDTSLADESVAN